MKQKYSMIWQEEICGNNDISEFNQIKQVQHILKKLTKRSEQAFKIKAK